MPKYWLGLTARMFKMLGLSFYIALVVTAVACGGRGVSTNTKPIGGTVVLASISPAGAITPTSTGVAGANVWLEQQSHQVNVQGDGGAAVENIVVMTQADANGNFQFPLVPQGTYEIVADAPFLPSSEAPSNATIATGVQQTSSGGAADLTIPLIAESGNPSAIQGMFTTTSASGLGATINFAGVQPFSTAGGGTVQALIPFFNNGTAPVPPQIDTSFSPGTGCTGIATCPFGTNCACYQIALPSSNPVVGPANTTGTGYALSASGQATYSIDGAATVIGSSAADCSPSELLTLSFVAPAGGITTAPEMDFNGCQ